jgi:hypothetical protein
METIKRWRNWRGIQINSKSDMSDITLLPFKNWSSSVTHGTQQYSAEGLEFLEANVSNCQLKLSQHGLHCGSHPSDAGL